MGVKNVKIIGTCVAAVAVIVGVLSKLNKKEKVSNL